MCKEAQEIMLLNIDKYSTIVPGVPQKTPQTSVSLSANPTTIPEVCGVFCGTPCTIVNVYQVSWEPSPVKWASRWDVYLEMSDTQIHWFSIINSVVVVFFLSGIITMIIIRYDTEVTDCNCEL